MLFPLVSYVGPQGWKKLSGNDASEFHYKYYLVIENVKSNQKYISMSKRLDHIS
jgi:hypothetical protein